jgi:ribosomal protein S18 acetylase RimI-like enzyme
MAAIRPARADDARAIGDVFLGARKASMGWLPPLHTDEETRAWLAGPMMRDCRVWVAGDPVEGFLALHGATIDHLYVLPEAQGRGTGTALLRLAQAMESRLRLFVFARNEGAARLYRRHGFRVIHEGDGSTNEEREPDLEMEWVR